MAQVDKLNYLPLLFWFVIFFLAIYIVSLTKVLPMLYTVLKSRRLFFISIFKPVRRYSKSIFFNYHTLSIMAYLSTINVRIMKVLNSRQLLVQIDN